LNVADQSLYVLWLSVGQIEKRNAEEQRQLLEKCAVTALSSKLVSQQKGFFSKMVVDAVLLLDELLPLNMIGVKKVPGGALEVSPWIKFQVVPFLSFAPSLPPSLIHHC
jgi:chaperonin GroEL (HSP60 family)